MKKINLLIVTGMSGAGKSVVLNSLEDVGYHCIDNFPPKLLPKLTDLIMGTSEHVVNLAVVRWPPMRCYTFYKIVTM